MYSSYLIGVCLLGVLSVTVADGDCPHRNGPGNARCARIRPLCTPESSETHIASIRVTAEVFCETGYGLLPSDVNPQICNTGYPHFRCPLPVPCCVIDCGPLAHPDGGSVNWDYTLLGGTAVYQLDCGDGAVREGDMMRVCQADGEWSGVEPSCIACTSGYRYGETGNAPSYSIYTPSEWINLQPGHDDETLIKVRSYNITWHFKTTDGSGIFMFSGPSEQEGLNERDEEDFVGAFLSNGMFTHEFDNRNGHGSATVGSGLDDGLWHVATIIKDNDDLQACIDGACTSGQAGNSFGGAHLFPEFYIAGVPANKRALANRELGLSKNFNGCIANLMVNGLTSPESPAQFRVSECFKCPEV